nr:ABC transporter permease [Saccharomonospora marina]
MSMLAIAGASLRRTLRDRAGLFFIVALPIIVILVVGATMRGTTEIRVGVTTGDGPLAQSLRGQLERTAGLVVLEQPDEEAAREALRRGEVQAAVLVPDDLDQALLAGGTAEIPVLTTARSESALAAISSVRGAVAEHAAAVQAAVFAAEQAGGSPAAWLDLARQLRATTPTVEVRTEVVDGDSDMLPVGFSYSAPTMLVLLVFINALAGGATMVENRKLGIYDRALAGPVLPRQLVLGETAFYGSMALLQSVLIVGVGAVLFG